MDDRERRAVGVGGEVMFGTESRTNFSLHNFRRLRIRFERHADIHEAFVK